MRRRVEIPRLATVTVVAACGVMMSAAKSGTPDPISDAPVRVAAAQRTPGAATPSSGVTGNIGMPANAGAPASKSQPAATSPPATKAPAEAPTPFQTASSKYQNGHQAEALAEFQQLAEQGDARAQYLLALDLIEGKYVPRNVAQGFAWLMLACDDKTFGDFVASKAREARTEIEPQLSGADLIHADQLVAQYRQRHPES